jgi:hypothetical protein
MKKIMTTIEQISKQYHLLTDWYISVLEDIKNEDGSKVISENTNSLEWLSGHLIVGRYRNIVRLGQQIEPYKYLDAFVDQTMPPPNFIAFDRNKKYPGLTECAEDWSKYSQIFIDSLNSVNEIILKTEIPLGVPTGGKTIEDLLTFVVLHETFHIGQMSIIRKALGYKAMQWYSRQENN